MNSRLVSQQWFRRLPFAAAAADDATAKARIEARQIERTIDQVVQGVFDGAGQQLAFEIHGNKTRAGVDVLVARHAELRYANVALEP